MAVPPTPPADSRPAPSLDAALVHAQFVRAVARGVLGGDRDVDDVLQETFLVARADAPRRPGALRAWLATVARRLALDRLRADGRRTRRERATARAEALPDVTALLVREETRRRLVEAVARLDEPYRTTVLWRYYAGKSVAEIAALLAVPLDTVRSRLQRALARLRDDLDAAHDGRRAAWAAALAPLATAGTGAGIATAVAGGWAVKKVLVTAAWVLGLGGSAWLVTRGPNAPDTHEAAHAPAPPASAASGHVEGADASPTVALAAAGRAAATPPPTTAGRGRGFTGVVVDPEGRPIADAEVTMFLVSFVFEGLPLARPLLDAVTARGVTDAAGRFEFPRPPWADAASRITTDVRVARTGWASATATLRDDHDARITLTRGGVVSVRVVGDDGRAIDGALVTWYEGEAPLVADPSAGLPAEVASTSTSDGGRASARLLAGTYRFRVASAGRRPVDGDPVAVVDGGTAHAEVTLDAGIVARFTVLDEVGAPVAGATVRTEGPRRSGGLATTDAAGECVIPGLALPVAGDGPGMLARSEVVAYVVEAEGFVTHGAFRRLPPAAGPFAVEVRLVRGVAVRVRATDVGGAPVAGARARWVPLPDAQPFLEPTAGPQEPGEDGWIRMPRVRPGPARLELSGGRPGEYEHAWRDVTVGPEGADLTMTLARLDGQLRVVVRLADDTPVAGAVVTFDPTDVPAAMRQGSPSATTDVEGRGLLQRLRCCPGELVVLARGRAAQRFPVDVLSGGPREPLVVRLRPGRSIAGRVVGRDGVGVADVAVDLNRREEVTAVGGARFVQLHTDGQTRTDADGRFRFEVDGDGAYGLAVPGNVWCALGASRDAQARPGTEDVVLRVKPASEGWGLPVRVRATSAGRPFEGALRLALVDADGRPWMGMERGRDPSGAFRFSLFQPPGTYDLTFHAPGHRPTVVRAVALDETPEGASIDVTLDRGAEIEVRVLDGDGAPRAKTWVLVNGETLETDGAGRCVSTGWPVTSKPFSFPVALASDPEYVHASTPLVPAPGSVTVTLRRRAALLVALGLPYRDVADDVTLRVHDAAGRVVDTQTLSATKVRARPGDAILLAAAWTDGPHRVEVTMGDRRADAAVDVQVGRRADVRVTWR